MESEQPSSAPKPPKSAISKSASPRTAPRWVGRYGEIILAARGRPIQLKRVFDRSPVPMVIVDSERRYIHANVAARLVLGLSLAELRRLRIEDLTPSHFVSELEKAWDRLLRAGCVGGRYEVAPPAGTRMELAYFAFADALPGLYLVAFAPAAWLEDELLVDSELPAGSARAPLTARELEVLQLAADGFSAPMIADELVLSTATVRTHFGNVYEKLEVRDRAAAVAKAMRLGLIT